MVCGYCADAHVGKSLLVKRGDWGYGVLVWLEVDVLWLSDTRWCHGDLFLFTDIFLSGCECCLVATVLQLLQTCAGCDDRGGLWDSLAM